MIRNILKSDKILMLNKGVALAKRQGPRRARALFWYCEERDDRRMVRRARLLVVAVLAAVMLVAGSSPAAGQE